MLQGGDIMRALLAIVAIVIAVAIYYIANRPAEDAPPSATAPEAAAEVQTPEPGIGLIDDERIQAAESEPGNWLAFGRTYEEQRFSPLTGINRENVGELGLAWFKDMGTNRALEATPIVVDGIMFFTTTWSRVYAVRATTGETVWTYDPQVPRE